ncbi:MULTISPECIES: Hsp20/alpha crystallin family protein [Segatella]|jgi:HSP20 family protein|nr:MULTISPECIES: Hsp20/alpha crystallin family protein [Segatella]MEE3415667.1 Hsp20/alpha crystallin family protein [Prevotella sp.]MDR4932195.1 Hsp20/alpha crystallin family protein [Segatella bryantii]UKK72437.1 Hsp20/alpha crystallin family protein [Segatella bryantii]UKK74969.1 Hsp20/alpha crystallin family protein [Segatella bryantii]UKK79622.1 Hsp20/alpha crystallin family protein [Segatella baroniae B14]
MMFPVNAYNWLDSAYDAMVENEKRIQHRAQQRRNSVAPVNVIANHQGYEMKMAVPGFSKDDFDITLTEEGNLRIKSVKNFKAHEKEHYLRREFGSGNFEQTYALPEDVDTEKITARVADGILSVSLPRAQHQQVNRVIDVA